MIFESNIIQEPYSLLKKWLFFILVLFMGKGCDYFIEIDPRVNIIGTTLLLIPLFFVLTKEFKYSLDRGKMFLVIVLYTAWLIYHINTDVEYPTYQGLKFLLLIVLGFLVVKCYGYHISEYFEYIVTRLTLLALILWIVEVAIGPSTMATFAPFGNSMHTHSRSFGLYSIITIFDADNSFLGLPRNVGFCWEPGQFASLIVLALTFYMLRTKFQFYKTYNFWILFLGLVSTFSTTGFVTFGVMMFLKTVFGNVSMNKRVIYGCILICLYLQVLDLPFMREKMEVQSDFDSFFTNSDHVYIGDAGYRTVERFEGMYLSWLNLLDKPFMGFGPNNNNSLVSHDFPMLLISNGNVMPLAKLGLLLGLPFYFILYKGTIRLASHFGYESKYIIFIVIMFFSVSYNYMFDIITLAIAFLNFCKAKNYE